MFESHFRPGYAWPLIGPPIYEARPIAVRVERGADLIGATYPQMIAFHEAGQLPFIDLGDVLMVTLEDLEKLVRSLPRIGDPNPQPVPVPRPTRKSRRRSPTMDTDA